MQALIIEADKTLATQLRTFLEADGHEVMATLYNGMTALQTLSTAIPDLIFLDVSLPNHWAETILHAVQKRFKVLPLVVLCAQKPADARYLMQRNPGLRFLQKPFSRPEVEAVLFDDGSLEPVVPYMLPQFR